MEIKIQETALLQRFKVWRYKKQNTIMKLENFPPRDHDAQKKEIENIKNIQKERFKSKDKYILDDSEFIENYNNALKSPQSRRLYKI